MERKMKNTANLSRAMDAAIRELHKSADAIISFLEDRRVASGYLTDSEERYLTRARHWRGVVESGE
jgi:hypothetical protein